MNAVTERPRIASHTAPWSLETAVTQNAAGDWLFDGAVVSCSLGGHESRARCNAMAKHLRLCLAPLNQAEREQFIREFNASQEFEV